MIFKEPKVELIQLEMADVIVTSGCNQETDQCPVGASKERPSVQTCSEGASQDQECPGEQTAMW